MSSERIGDLDTLPLFFKASGKRIVVAGGGEPAAWKIELVAASGAQVVVFAQTPCAAIKTLAQENAAIALHERPWREEDLRGALLAICQADDEDEAARFYAAARAAGAPVNVIDKPAFCDFQFGSIVNRSPLIVAIATGGAAPVLGQAIRARIETLLPPGMAAWAKAARDWRGAVTARARDFRARRAFWERFSDRALAEPDRTPEESDRDALLASLDAAPATRGKVMLVGAGPGDPQLLTLRAVRALQSADVVVYDDLVAPAALEMARREAERIYVGKRGGKQSAKQADISALLVELAQAGRNVVRLKGGDPLIFGRANEEIAALAQAGFPVEVTPGVTAASGAAAALGVSLTERDLARRVQFVTGHSNEGRLPEDFEWRALADPRATTVYYMVIRTIAPLTARLVQEGLPPGTPAIVVESATMPNERVIVSTLAGAAAAVAQAQPKGPCLLIVGAALRQARP
ncbi:MAG: uroporphyrinogen-III C-methyltransferase [Hyphomicrobiales bacterium]|nr:uroporphyrinogen-III C-methyltransferase [Hyphomicrobiales bacterium]